VIKPDGTDLRKVSYDPGREQIPIFSPDGKWLFFQSNKFGSYDIFRVPWD